MGLITLTKVKEYLGETTTDYDDFLQDQIDVVSEAVESYCGRKFALDTYTQTFYDDQFDFPPKEIYTFHYPLVSVSSVVQGSEDITSSVRVHNESGHLYRKERFLALADDVVVQYQAGFAEIPAPVRSAVFSIVAERYNKKVRGLDLGFGSDVQSISVPGSINIQFDYTLQSNERTSKFGMLLQNYINMLDPYRSERVISSGSIVRGYVS